MKTTAMLEFLTVLCHRDDSREAELSWRRVTAGGAAAPRQDEDECLSEPVSNTLGLLREGLLPSAAPGSCSFVSASLSNRPLFFLNAKSQQGSLRAPRKPTSFVSLIA